MDQQLERPWHLLPEDIKQWVRDNGFVVRETKKGGTVFSDWKTHYKLAN